MPSQSRFRVEPVFVLLTGMGKLVFVNFLDIKFWFVIFACFGWLLFLVWNVLKHPERLRDWGFKFDGFAESLRVLIIPAIIVILMSSVYGFSKGNAVLNWHIFPVLVLYPIWGTVQQWLLICLFGNVLIEQKSVSISIVYLITALLFAFIHYPSVLLMVGTFILSMVYLYVFSKYKNILILGLFHGWLGGIFFYFVLGRDAWQEFIKVF